MATSILYTNVADVQIRLAGKVRFTEDPEKNPDLMSIALLQRLISEAEGDLEHDLSIRYIAPFQTEAGEPFSALPLRPTREMIRTLAEFLSVLRVLETDFGSGTATDAAKYSEKTQTRYDKTVTKLIGREDPDSTFGKFKYPPLPGLRLNFHNKAADDGYYGFIGKTGRGDGSFPAAQINDPSENFWNGEIDDLPKDRQR